MIRLVHWNEDEARERAQRIEKLGYKVAWKMGPGPEFLAGIREKPPQAFVIDLTRLPSHGREVALGLRSLKATRHVPLIFIEGDLEKTAKLRRQLPDATYTKWSGIGPALKKALREPVRDPVVPKSVIASDAPLAHKLGIREGMRVALLQAPPGFQVPDPPPGVKFTRQVTRESDLILWFVGNRAELEGGIDPVAQWLGKATLWIAWPKGGSSDVSQPVVRRIAKAAGLNEFKVCSFNETWSGMRYAAGR